VNEAVAAIKAKGYWQLVLRPQVYRVDRLRVQPNATNLVQVIASVSVQLRGWDYPHTNLIERIEIEQDCVGQTTSWTHFHETWRCYRSGQFVHLAGMRHDWGAERQLGLTERVPAEANILGIRDALFRLTEMLLFARGYCHLLIPGEAVDVLVEVGGLRERRLVVDSPSAFGFGDELVATTSNPYTVSFVVDAATTEDDAKRMAREGVAGLFGLFGWSTGDAILAGWQDEIRRW